MVTNDGIIDVNRILTVLSNEEEFIFKPFQSGSANNIGAIECGRVVSRTNKSLFDYQIGDKTNSSIIGSVLSCKIVLTMPETKQVVLEFYENFLPFICRMCTKQDVRYPTTQEGQTQSLGSIRKGVAFGKVWYDIYDNRREHAVSLMLRKGHLRSKIQHRVPEFEIIDNDETTKIGRIYPFSTDLERSDYRKAVAVKVPVDMKVETKAILLMATLVVKARLA